MGEKKSLHQLAMKWSHLCLKLTRLNAVQWKKKKKTGVNLSKLCPCRRTTVWVKCLIFMSQSLLSCRNHSPWHLFEKCRLVSSWNEFWSPSAQTDTHFQTWTVQVQFHLDLSSDAAVFGDWDESCLLIGQPLVGRYFTCWHDYRQQNHGWWIRCGGLSFLHQKGRGFPVIFFFSAILLTLTCSCGAAKSCSFWVTCGRRSVRGPGFGNSWRARRIRRKTTETRTMQITWVREERAAGQRRVTTPLTNRPFPLWVALTRLINHPSLTVIH